jgi:hypothetical protein
MLSPHKHDLVLITWDDAGELALGWVQDSEIVPKELLAYSVGFLVKKTPKHVVLASTVGEPSANTNQFQIPRKMIKSIEIIVPKRAVFLDRRNQNTDESPDDRRDPGKVPGSDNPER